MMAAQRGYKCVITMAEPFSVERRKLMRMLGAKVIVTPKAGKGTGMVEKAAELAEKHGWFLCHQFETDANWRFHEATTGPEILNDLKSIGAKLGEFCGQCRSAQGRFVISNESSCICSVTRLLGYRIWYRRYLSWCSEIHQGKIA